MHLLLFALFALCLSACQNLDSPSGETSASSMAAPLIIRASADRINSGANIDITANGGTGVYVFSVVLGGGTLGPYQGGIVAYSSPTGLTVDNDVTISVTDSAGATKSTVIKILGTAIPTGSKLFNLSGTGSFSVPMGVTAIKVTVIGGGGAAGMFGAHTTSSGPNISSWGGGGGGGGAGGICQGKVIVASNQVLGVQVGKGGDGGVFVGSTYAGTNSNGLAGVSSLFSGMVAGGGLGGLGGSGSYPAASGAAGGNGGAGGICAAAGSLASIPGANGTSGQPASQVAGQQSAYHADGGTGGAGNLINTTCGRGATGDIKSVYSTPSPAGAAGCVLVEWGSGI